MLLSRTTFLATIAFVFGFACSPPVNNNDAAADAQTEDATDVVVDTGPPPPTPMLTGACMADTDCPDGATCLLNTDGWPGGMCSHTCARDLECDTGVSYIYSVCRPLPGSTGPARNCMRQCLNGFDCGRAGYTCLKASDTAQSGVCVPSCTADSCGEGARCNEWTGQCMATSATYPPAGADDGQPCAMASDCRSGACIAQASATGVQSGWNGGYCASSCAIPSGWNSTSLYAGDTFPQGNCPSGAICFPNSSDYAEQGPGDCYDGCTMDSDCRAAQGYYCRRTFNLGRIDAQHNVTFVPHTWNNGFCAPVDCLNDTMHPCPTGYMCESRSQAGGGMYGRCVPMM